MNPLKLLISFMAGVALTLLLTGHVLTIPALSAPSFLSDDGLFRDLELIGLIVLVAFLAAALSARGGKSGGLLQRVRAFRASKTDCWLGGICGGLGQATPIPSWVWRLAFAVTIFYYGAGLLVYFLLWLFIPDGDGIQANVAHEPNTFFGFLHRLKRSDKDSWLGGVCGGLGEITTTPTWIWRLSFTVLALCFGAGFGVYILLWIFLPLDEAKNHFAA